MKYPEIQTLHKSIVPNLTLRTTEVQALLVSLSPAELPRISQTFFTNHQYIYPTTASQSGVSTKVGGIKPAKLLQK